MGREFLLIQRESYLISKQHKRNLIRQFLSISGCRRDLVRAEELFKRGLSVTEVECREDIVDRLASLYEDQGQDAEAKVIGKEEARLQKPPASPEKPVVRAEKAGRNDPCPCGSGKKYQKCRGA